jgi:hypothetical protein
MIKLKPMNSLLSRVQAAALVCAAVVVGTAVGETQGTVKEKFQDESPDGLFAVRLTDTSPSNDYQSISAIDLVSLPSKKTLMQLPISDPFAIPLLVWSQIRNGSPFVTQMVRATAWPMSTVAPATHLASLILGICKLISKKREM